VEGPLRSVLPRTIVHPDPDLRGRDPDHRGRGDQSLQLAARRYRPPGPRRRPPLMTDETTIRAFLEDRFRASIGPAPLGTDAPLSTLRTLSGGEVYATFYFIDTRFPADRPISTFKLDDRLRFAVSLRAFKNIAVEGRIVFDHQDRLAAGRSAEEAGLEAAAE